MTNQLIRSMDQLQADRIADFVEYFATEIRCELIKYVEQHGSLERWQEHDAEVMLLNIHREAASFIEKVLNDDTRDGVFKSAARVAARSAIAAHAYSQATKEIEHDTA